MNNTSTADASSSQPASQAAAQPVLSKCAQRILYALAKLDPKESMTLGTLLEQLKAFKQAQSETFGSNHMLKFLHELEVLLQPEGKFSVIAKKQSGGDVTKVYTLKDVPGTVAKNFNLEISVTGRELVAAYVGIRGSEMNRLRAAEGEFFIGGNAYIIRGKSYRGSLIERMDCELETLNAPLEVVGIDHEARSIEVTYTNKWGQKATKSVCMKTFTPLPNDSVGTTTGKFQAVTSVVPVENGTLAHI